MALIKCKECEKEYSDTLDACPHCGYKRENEEKKDNKDEKNTIIDNYVKEFISDKNRLITFIFGLIAIICSWIFLTEMSLKGIPLIFTICILVSSIATIVYTLKVLKKYNNDVLVGGIVIAFVGFLLRTIQTGIGYSWQYFVAYFLFSIGMIMLLYKFTKNKGNQNFEIIFLFALAIYDIIEFCTSKFVFVHGISWKIYHLSEAALFFSYIFAIRMNNKKFDEFLDKLANYKKQIPSQKITIGITIIIAIIVMIVGIVKQSNTEVNNNTYNNDYDHSIIGSSSNNDNNNALQNEKEKQEYIDNQFKLIAGDVKYFENPYSDNKWGLENIEVKNTGSKNIKSFKVTVYFQNDAGENIAEDTFTISELIKANYSWKMENGIYYSFDNLSSEVDPNKNSIKITDITFETVTETIQEEKQEYIDNQFKLIAGDIKYFENPYSDNEWGLENIEVKNTGSKNIKSFKVTVYFQDETGNNIAEDSFIISESIKANYSWKMESGMYYSFDNLASEVNPNKNIIKITDITFEN